MIGQYIDQLNEANAEDDHVEGGAREDLHGTRSASPSRCRWLPATAVAPDERRYRYGGDGCCTHVHGVDAERIAHAVLVQMERAGEAPDDRVQDAVTATVR
ncbi:hypothetical protein SGLAM104S_00530 [Streptomyces glaucescens]